MNQNLSPSSTLEMAENELRSLPLINPIEVKISFPDLSWWQNLLNMPRTCLTYEGSLGRLGFSNGYTWKGWRSLSMAEKMVAAQHIPKLLEQARKKARKF